MCSERWAGNATGASRSRPAVRRRAFEKIWRPNGVNETKRYLDGEVIVTSRSNGTQDTEYLFTDQLGSTDVVTDTTGTIVQSMAFDAFGKRRDPINYAAFSQTTIFNFDTTHTTKGFTGHEGLDPVGLIHMNGRVYEPKLGRFLSADSIVQDPSSTQSLNRYTYGFNNPLSGTDPTGQSWLAAAAWAVAAYAAGEAARTYNKPWLATIAQIAGCAYGYCVQASMGGTYGATHDVNATLKSGAIAGASQIAFGQIHKTFGDVNPAAPAAARTAGSLIEQGIAHGVVGGVLAELRGGKFGNGFISAGLGFAAGAAGQIRGWSDSTNVVVATIVGGTTSEITGGQFANGAVTSAFGYIMNDMARENRPSYKKMEESYPSEDADVLFANIGGMVAVNAESWINSCTVRISLSLNQNGADIPFIEGQTSSGRDGKWYLYRVKALEKHLGETWGRPDIVGRQASDFAGKRGVMVFDVPKWLPDATGHATLWNGSSTVDGTRYFHLAERVMLWELPE